MGGYMIKIENFDKIIPSGITYGGHSGSKKGIIYNNERWFLKYPKSTKSMDIENLSYTTSPLSEYLASHIYSLLGFDTHETLLGISNGKVVVACKDFLNQSETILDYNSIKNDYDKNIEEKIENLFSSNSNRTLTDLEETIIIMNNNTYFKKVPELKLRFWDMFIVDAFINNNDRNDNNWGLILDRNNMNLRLSPIYDNGASFYSKSPDEKLINALSDNFKKKQLIYDNCKNIFSENGKPINPLKYIEKMQNEDCNEALLRVFPKINLTEIKNLIDSIPNEYKSIPIISINQKELYYESLTYKYNILETIYNTLKNN